MCWLFVTVYVPELNGLVCLTVSKSTFRGPLCPRQQGTGYLRDVDIPVSELKRLLAREHFTQCYVAFHPAHSGAEILADKRRFAFNPMFPFPHVSLCLRFLSLFFDLREIVGQRVRLRGSFLTFF